MWHMQPRPDQLSMKGYVDEVREKLESMKDH